MHLTTIDGFHRLYKSFYSVETITCYESAQKERAGGYSTCDGSESIREN